MKTIKLKYSYGIYKEYAIGSFVVLMLFYGAFGDLYYGWYKWLNVVLAMCVLYFLLTHSLSRVTSISIVNSETVKICTQMMKFDVKKRDFLSMGTKNIKIVKRHFNIDCLVNRQELMEFMLDFFECEGMNDMNTGRIENVSDTAKIICTNDTTVYFNESQKNEDSKNLQIMVITVCLLAGIFFIYVVIADHWSVAWIIGLISFCACIALYERYLMQYIPFNVNRTSEKIKDVISIIVCTVISLFLTTVVVIIFKYLNVDLMNIRI